jgi:predicted site-specific integrase-resolvase
MITEPLLSDYLTEEEAARELGVCTKTLKRWHVLGTGPAVTRLGRRILYRRITLAGWLVGREQARVSHGHR